MMIKYEGRCVPASYSVEVESDGLVRTLEVEYSILAELPVAERLAYKGITKKRIRVAVLILPVEERDQDSFCGGRLYQQVRDMGIKRLEYLVMVDRVLRGNMVMGSKGLEYLVMVDKVMREYMLQQQLDKRAKQV